MRVALTGASGFLGWHLRCRLAMATDHEVVALDRQGFGSLSRAIEGADAVIHVAGINRGTADEVTSGNVCLAEAVATAARSLDRPPRLVFANSIQAERDNPYGQSKRRASEVLASAGADCDVPFVDVQLPNLFGEHGRPGYNSFVATFVHDVVTGRQPQVTDNQVELLHVQAAAQALIEGLTGPSRTARPRGERHGVAEVLTLLHGFNTYYRDGEIPALLSPFSTQLFNTYRAAAFQERGPMRFQKRTDRRGSLVETVKVHGGGGQTFFSSTVPGVTRGEHYHERKIERFVVIDGQARIRLRKLFTDEVLAFDVTGEEPVAVDMPTFWVHNITNTGDRDLYTLFWTDSVFDPEHPDTYAQPVEVP